MGVRVTLSRSHNYVSNMTAAHTIDYGMCYNDEFDGPDLHIALSKLRDHFLHVVFVARESVAPVLLCGFIILCYNMF